METYLEVERVDLTLSAAQRTALGLGPIASDPRNAAVRVALCVQTPTGARCEQVFFYAFERATTTRSQLRAALVAQARVLLDAARGAEAEGALVGTRIRVD